MDEPSIDGIKINPAARKVIAGMFVHELPEDLEHLKQSIAANDLQAVVDFVHKYQLRLRYLGLLDILLLCHTIVESIEMDEHDMLDENLCLLLDKLHKTYKNLNCEGTDR